MYSLNCEWYPNQFSSIEKLIDAILESGMDPNYEITFNGVDTGEFASDFLCP
jgi:hypothetical protein